MLSFISWREFLVFLLLLNAAYYLFIWIFLFKGRIPALQALRPGGRGGHTAENDFPSTSGYVTEELSPLFSRYSNKNELLLALRSRLQPYLEWQEEGFRESVNAFILRQSRKESSLALSEEEVRSLWNH